MEGFLEGTIERAGREHQRKTEETVTFRKGRTNFTHRQGKVSDFLRKPERLAHQIQNTLKGKERLNYQGYQGYQAITLACS